MPFSTAGLGQTSQLTAQTSAGKNGAVDTGAAATKLAENMDSFLQMLTTQLKNQDPLSPMESTEFTNQLVGFAQVEQQIGMNSNLQSLQSLQRQNQQSLALGFIGRFAEVVDDQVSLQDGKARFAYSLERDARHTEITIKNAQGETVRTMPAKLMSGNHIADWDGTNNNGEKVPDGVYEIGVNAWHGDSKEPKKLTTVVEARITAVSTGEDEPYLTINGMALPLSNVRTISEGPTM